MLPVATEDKERLAGLSSFTLSYNGDCVAIMRKPEFYPHRKEERVCRQFGTWHRGHPYIKVSSLKLILKFCTQCMLSLNCIL